LRARGGHEQGRPPRISPPARPASTGRCAGTCTPGTIEQAIFETLLTYDYLARPAKLVPLTAEALPQITENGKVYTLKVRKGIHFSRDPAFKGRARELVAGRLRVRAEAASSIRSSASPWAWLVEGQDPRLDEQVGGGERRAASRLRRRRSRASRRPTGYTLRIR
jgi:hypothetical protein